MEHFKASFGGLDVVVRDLAPDDIDAIVTYWFDRAPAFLGADRAKLGTRESLRKRLAAGLSAAERGRCACYVADSGNALLAYAAFPLRAPAVAAAHVHVLAQRPRQRAIVYFLFPRVLALAFSRLSLQSVQMETVPGNAGIARLLARFGLVPQRIFIDDPQSLGRPGEFDVYRIDANGVRRLAARNSGLPSDRTRA